MLRDAAISHIKRRLGFYTKKDSDILDELQGAQERLESGILVPSGGGIFLPWFLISEIASITATTDEERIPLPTDFLREVTEDGFWLFDSTADAESQWTPLRKDDLDFLRGEDPGSGSPVAYASLGGYFRLKPTPDDSQVLKLIYFNKDTVLSSNITNQWLTYSPFLLIGEAGREMALALRDKEATSHFQGLTQMEAQRLFASNEARMHDNRSYVMGGED